MTTFERTLRAHRLVRQFVEERRTLNVPPDTSYFLEGSMDPISPVFGKVSYFHDGGDLDGWVIAFKGQRCVVGLSDGTIIEGRLKIVSILLRGDRKIVSSYGLWNTYSDRKLFLGAMIMSDELADVIIESLDTS